MFANRSAFSLTASLNRNKMVRRECRSQLSNYGSQIGKKRKQQFSRIQATLKINGKQVHLWQYTIDQPISVKAQKGLKAYFFQEISGCQNVKEIRQYCKGAFSQDGRNGNGANQGFLTLPQAYSGKGAKYNIFDVKKGMQKNLKAYQDTIKCNVLIQNIKDLKIGSTLEEKRRRLRKGVQIQLIEFRRRNRSLKEKKKLGKKRNFSFCFQVQNHKHASCNNQIHKIDPQWCKITLEQPHTLSSGKKYPRPIHSKK